MSVMQLPFLANEPNEKIRTLTDLLPLGRPSPVTQDLFYPSHRRALLRAIGGGLRCDGDVDVHAAVAMVARCEPIEDFPREWVHTTRGAMHLLLDAEMMTGPYCGDVLRFPRDLEREAGPDGLEIRWFEGCPLSDRGVLLPGRADPEPYRMPARGTRILAVTTFGSRGTWLSAPARMAEWRRMSETARRAGTPLVILTPLLPPSRPDGLPQGLAIITWDRTTGVRETMRMARRASPPPRRA